MQRSVLVSDLHSDEDEVADDVDFDDSGSKASTDQGADDGKDGFKFRLLKLVTPTPNYDSTVVL